MLQQAPIFVSLQIYKIRPYLLQVCKLLSDLLEGGSLIIQVLIIQETHFLVGNSTGRKLKMAAAGRFLGLDWGWAAWCCSRRPQTGLAESTTATASTAAAETVALLACFKTDKLEDTVHLQDDGSATEATKTPHMTTVTAEV